MNKTNVIIWGRSFELDVIFQTFTGKDVIENQMHTLENIKYVDFDIAKPGVEKYIRKYHNDELDAAGTDNFFRFVMPKSLFIMRNANNRVFAVMCKYKFDMEHGLAIVFENEQFLEAGPQDLVL